jgi:hypothetical protein
VEFGNRRGGKCAEKMWRFSGTIIINRAVMAQFRPAGIGVVGHVSRIINNAVESLAALRFTTVVATKNERVIMTKDMTI